MIKRLLIVDGVNAVCSFRDDGVLVEAYGLLSQAAMVEVARAAHHYRRILQSHADQFSMFSGMRGWTPPRGWIIRGKELSLCGVNNIACVADNAEIDFNEVLSEMQDIANW